MHLSIVGYTNAPLVLARSGIRDFEQNLYTTSVTFDVYQHRVVVALSTFFMVWYRRTEEVRPKLETSSRMSDSEKYSDDDRHFIVQEVTMSLHAVVENNPASLENVKVLAVQVESKIHKRQPTRSAYSSMIGLAFDLVTFIIAFRRAFVIKINLDDAMQEIGLVSNDN